MVVGLKQMQTTYYQRKPDNGLTNNRSDLCGVWEGEREREREREGEKERH